jgi:glycosyltransferase involved in cell wall biosynthesis
VSVDVVLPVFNGERFVRRAVESVRTQQGDEQLTLWCVDDHSTDGSREILDALALDDERIVVLTNAGQRGVAAARNAAITAGHAEFIAFIDQDDEWVGDKLSRQLSRLRSRPDLGFVVGHQEFRIEDGARAPDWLRPDWLERPQPGYLPSALLARRDTFDRVGPFDEHYRVGGDDSDWFARARRLGIRDEVLAETVFIRGVHDANRSADPRTSDEVLKLVRSHLAAGGGAR